MPQIRKLFKNLVTIFCKHLFGKLVHLFGQSVHIFGELAHIFGELDTVSADFARKLVSKFFETSFEQFGAIMATLRWAKSRDPNRESLAI